MNHPIHPHCQSNSTYNEIAKNAMQWFWGKDPRGFQIEAIRRLLLMQSNPNYSPTTTILVVQPTGSGKSMVPLTTGVVSKGVTLVIENTLALSSDRISKFDNNNSDKYHQVEAFQLDSIKSAEEIDVFMTFMKGLTSTTPFSIFIYSSPEFLLKKHWVIWFNI